MTPRPQIIPFLHERSSTITYLVSDSASRTAAVIDPTADFDLSTGRLDPAPADRVLEAVEAAGLVVQWVLETHVHADHVTSAQYLKEHTGATVAIGARIIEVQETFAPVFAEGHDFVRDGSQFDHLFQPDEQFSIGTLGARAVATPGHTPACMSYLIGDAVFVGDTIFMPDFGTARCDFPGGAADQLYHSARRILELPLDTRVFVGHDYGPGGREIMWESTVSAQKRHNIHIHDGIGRDEFVTMRTERDARLGLPNMIIAAIQINMRAGRLPKEDTNGINYLKIPVNGFPGAS